MRLTLFAAVTLACSTAQAKDGLAWKTEPFAASCNEVKQPSEGEGDFVLYRCAMRDGPPMWQLFNEGVRMSIGFGSRENYAIRYANAQRGDWPVLWGGRNENRSFKAEVAVVRMNSYGLEKDSQFLTVIKLVGREASCVIASIPAGPSDNAQAKAAAGGPCLNPPDFN
jgi:hypothetical protein